jgi:hypothetical protein
MHYVSIEDETGDLVELTPYCSDSCASTDPLYAGWFGAQESADYVEWCARCGVRVSIGTEEGCDWECLPNVVALAYVREDPEPCKHGVPTYLNPQPVEDPAEEIQRAIEASQLLSAIGSHFA